MEAWVLAKRTRSLEPRTHLGDIVCRLGLGNGREHAGGELVVVERGEGVFGGHDVSRGGKSRQHAHLVFSTEASQVRVAMATEARGSQTVGEVSSKRGPVRFAAHAHRGTAWVVVRQAWAKRSLHAATPAHAPQSLANFAKCGKLCEMRRGLA